MTIRHCPAALALALGALLYGPVAGAASGPQPQPVIRQTWTALGGDLGFIWNVELLNDYGIKLKGAAEGASIDTRGFVAVPLRDQSGLSFAVTETNFDHFTSGRLVLRGGFRLTTPVGEISLVDAVLQPRGNGSQMLDVVDASGRKLFYLDRLMYAIADQGRTVEVQTMDLRMHADLAQRLGKPEITDWVVAQMRMNLSVVAQDGNYIHIVQGTPVWPGTVVPDVTPEQTYQADVFMLSFQPQYSRCTPTWPAAGGTCDGPNAATDGYAVFTPSSTLRNNVNDGTAQPTVAGDPNGTSTALYTADVAWYRKFSGTFPPYDNDQHPNLIWNLYRVDSNNRIEQIGRSGVKHAFVTTNSGCSSGPGSGGSTGTILGRSCSDTYGTGNNDSNNDLGPRSEIIPAQDLWGRCGSIFDPECDQVLNTGGGNTSYSQRMLTRESQLTAGGTYYFESWYIVRDDVNIYNTMASRPVTFSFGSSWSITAGAPQLLGPVINRWVSPTTSDPNQKNVEIASSEGHTRVAVNVVDLGNGSWRYDYAVMNLDFARAVTQGTPKYGDDSDAANRFRVIHNFGFDRFSVPLTGATVSAIEFNDGELDSTNDWTASVADGKVTWTAPVNPTPPVNTPAVRNPLSWGTLFRFSFVANRGPVAADIDLHVAQSGAPASYTATVLGPEAVDAIFADGFEAATR